MEPLKFREVNEQTRTYHFPHGSVVVADVVRIAISGSTHRLECKDGTKVIIPSGWMAIELEVDSWSF